MWADNKLELWSEVRQLWEVSDVMEMMDERRGGMVEWVIRWVVEIAGDY